MPDDGAGKTTFCLSHLHQSGLLYISADVLAAELSLAPYAAARVANALRRELVRRGESFIFETVFSDPIGDKLAFLREAEQLGYTVVLLFIGVSGPAKSEERVAMRVSRGGHDVPSDKLWSRYPRTLANLKAAIAVLANVLVYDNENWREPFRQIAVYQRGALVSGSEPVPEWFATLMNH